MLDRDALKKSPETPAASQALTERAPKAAARESQNNADYVNR